MVKYKFSNGGLVLTIFDSHKVSKSAFQKRLNQIRALHKEQPVFHRTDRSLRMEWATHNALYDIGLLRSHTKNVDFEYPQSAILSIAYAIFGSIAWIFIH